MKKLFLVILIIFSLTLLGSIGVSATIIEGDLDFEVYDNERYDLLTGVRSSNINYSITNKMSLFNNMVDDEIVFSTVDFHHVLYFNEYNVYMGYSNTASSDLELSSYIGYDVNEGDGTLAIPDGADKIALMVYNYNDTRNLVAYTYDSIDVIAWYDLTYRDIFEGNDLIINGDFSDGTNDWYLGSNNTYTITDEVLNVISTGSVSNTAGNHTGKTSILTENNVVYFSYDVQYISGSISFRSFYPAYTFTYDSFDVMTSISYIETVSFGGFGNVFVFGPYGSAGEYNIDNVSVYDFTDIFEPADFPTTEQFETMKDYYNLNKDVSGDDLSYNDIYGNNIITNEFFNEDISSFNFSTRSNTSMSIINGELEVKATATYTSAGIQKSRLNDVLYYYSYDIYSNDVNLIRVNVGTESHDITDIKTKYSIIVSHATDGAFRIYASMILDEVFILDNMYSYNLLDIFTSGHEQDIEFMDDGLEVYIDPHEESYTNYYPAVNLIIMDITYLYDDTPPADPDAVNSIDEGLLKMGVESEEMKVFLALTIMIVVAVFIGLKTRNSQFIIISEVVLTIIFTMLGWFSFWILLIMALGFTLLILRKGFKGGKE